MRTVGDSPSGKALGSGPSIRGFESLVPSQNSRNKKEALALSFLRRRILAILSVAKNLLCEAEWGMRDQAIPHPQPSEFLSKSAIILKGGFSVISGTTLFLTFLLYDTLMIILPKFNDFLIY